MKQYYIMFFLLTILSFSQDIIDPPKLFDKNSYDVIQNYDNEFKMGWNWGTPGYKLDEALNIRYYHHLDANLTDYIDSVRLIMPLKDIWDNDTLKKIIDGVHKISLCNAQAAYFSPKLSINQSNPIDFQPIKNDETGAVFGFMNRNFNVGDTVASGENYYSFILNKNSLSGNSEIVLSDVYSKQIIRYLNLSELYLENDINTYNMYLSLNLKSLDSIPESKLNDTVLSIQLPYLYRREINDISFDDTDSLIQFYRFPKYTGNINNDIEQIYGSYHNDYRGKARAMSEDTIPRHQNITTWYITGKMLDTDGNGQPDENITLSAMFICGKNFKKKLAKDSNFVFNPHFKPFSYGDGSMTEYINELDIKVSYHGNLDVAINWVRLETPHAQRLFRGERDLLIKKSLDSTINLVQNNPKNMIIYRFYGTDELQKAEYCANRYYNMLLDTLASSESFVLPNNQNRNEAKQYLHATGLNEFWNGTNIHFTAQTAHPYVKKAFWVDGKRVADSFKYLFGYAGRDDFINRWILSSYGVDFDSLNSGYESFLSGDYNTMPLPTDTIIYNYHHFGIKPYNSRFGTLFAVEDRMWNGLAKNPDLLFNEKNWWANIWLDSKWVMDISYNTFTTDGFAQRPKTAQEYRLQNNIPIFLGAKGLIYWKKSTDASGLNPRFDQIGLQPLLTTAQQSSLPNGLEYIYSKNIGSDYIDIDDDPFRFDEFYQNIYNWDVLGIDENHIYIGALSQRIELFKISKYINTNEKLLMDLELISWHNKGFINWTRNHLNFSINIQNFIDTTKLQSKPIGRLYFENGISGIDSSFCFISLFKKNDKELKNEFYLGVVNKRTDPLFLRKEIEGGDTVQYMQFFSSAEFEDSCAISPLPSQHSSNPTKWRDYYWKRLGCREIKIQFNYQNPDNPDEYALLRITQPGYDALSQNFTWYQEPWRDNIDTVIGQDRSITLRYLPGEGKLLKVEVLHPEEITGDLDHSNQTKLVAYPEIDPATGNYTNEIRYHLVYHKNEGVVNNVYYRRSLPINFTSDKENIIWEAPVNLNKNIAYIDIFTDEEDTKNFAVCGYPSIVVKKLGSSLKAHIVFKCSGKSDSYNDQYSFRDPIVMSEFEVSSPNPICTSQVSSEILVKETEGKSLKQWGTPMINASLYGNYVVWSDSLWGIGALYRDYSVSPLNVNNGIFLHVDTYRKAQHPSVNSYSNENENYCGLVWQENGTSFGDVYFTELHYSSPNIYKQLNYNIIRANPNSVPIVNNIMKVSDALVYTANTSFPVITKSKPYSLDIVGRITSVRDYDISYVSRKYDIFNIGAGLRTRKLQITDLGKMFVSSEKILLSSEIKYINSFNTVLNTNKQYSVPYDGQMLTFLGLESISDLCFSVFNQHTPYLTPYSKIIKLSYVSSLITKDNILSSNSSLFNNIASTTNYRQSHLSDFPLISYDKEEYMNRRIFEIHRSPTDTSLITSANTFYKSGESALEGDAMAGFYTGAHKYLITTPYLNDEALNLRLPYRFVQDSVNGNRFEEYHTDTLYTDWFHLDNQGYLEFKCVGNDSAFVDMHIERYSDNARFPLNIPEGPLEFGYLIYSLINGQNDDYRIVFSNLDTLNGAYEEMFWIDGVPIIDTLLAKRTFNDPMVVNLGKGIESDNDIEIILYPNPADEVVTISCLYSNKLLNELEKDDTELKIEVYDMTGRVVMRYTTDFGIKISIPTSNLPIGRYMFKASKYINGYDYVYGSESLIISR